MQKKITFDDIQKAIGRERVVFWGASSLLETLLKDAPYIFPNVLGIVDKNIEKQGKDFYGYKIITPEELHTLDADGILMTISSNHIKNYKELQKETKQYPQYLLPNIFELSKEDLQVFETQNTHIFNNLINNSTWCKRRDFIPLKAAANYSFLCLLYIILDYFQPQKILEFGLGQTSKLTSQYAQNKNKSATVQIIEHDSEWIEYFSQQFQQSNNIQTILKGIQTFELNGTLTEKYEDLSDVTKDNKYNLIIIDGPISKALKYPRTNVLDLIPQNLDKDFIIILDDAERTGEKNTTKLISNLLTDNNIKFYKKYRQGLKTQCIFTSESCKFATIY